MDILKTLTLEFNLKSYQVENTVKLLDDGNTVPFIARYRKELTGSLDDQLLRELSDRLTYLRSLDERREAVISSIEEQGALTEEIKNELLNAKTLTEIEDIYRPYKPKRKTRATIALAKGLKPLADSILSGEEKELSVLAEKYIDPEKEVNTVEEALNGASDIIAEIISDDASIRRRLRVVLENFGFLTASSDKEDMGVYEMYRDFKEKLSKIASHRILAVNRGEKDGILKVSVEFEEERALKIINSTYAYDTHPHKEFLENTVKDSYNRLLFPSLEREVRNEKTESASEKAIKIFALNLKQLLMQPPVKGKTTLGLDPGYRTGCKVAVIDETGKVLAVSVIYPAPPHNKIEEAEKIIADLIRKHSVEIIAIGNGTASHETEVFAANLIKKLALPVQYMVVSEAGASVYSASKLAAKEFPDFDVSLRSAVSIARRLEDPLAELVKIDPKAIGVGQYQHDMPQNELGHALDGVVESCVNSVGVDLNTASSALLSRVSGLSNAVAENIVAYREENGAFKSRAEILKVPKLGPKAYQQCAGFLRIIGGKNALDATAVHPESYDAAKKLIDLCGYDLKDISKMGLSDISERISEKGEEEVAEKIGVGVPTLIDIAEFLGKPSRDPRDDLPAPMLRSDVLSLEDLKPGMELKGTVRNVVDFGAFVDIGVHEDGLVHISEICDRFIRHPSEELSVGDIVKVYVLSVDTNKKRISLTMKKKEN
jgi:uncharacterized protein